MTPAKDRDVDWSARFKKGDVVRGNGALGVVLAVTEHPGPPRWYELHVDGPDGVAVWPPEGTVIATDADPLRKRAGSAYEVSIPRPKRSGHESAPPEPCPQTRDNGCCARHSPTTKFRTRGRSKRSISSTGDLLWVNNHAIDA